MVPITPFHYLVLSAALFMIGVIGVMVRRNVIVIFMSIELMLNAVNINLAAFSHQLQNAVGQVFAVFVIALDTEVGVRQADRSLVEMARAFGARPHQVYTKVLVWSALPEILAGVRLGAIRGVKGVVIGQLLVAIIGVGELFELYSKHFLMEEFWALVIVVFLFAFAVSEAIAALERRVEYYARAR